MTSDCGVRRRGWSLSTYSPRLDDSLRGADLVTCERRTHVSAMAGLPHREVPTGLELRVGRKLRLVWMQQARGGSCLVLIAARRNFRIAFLRPRSCSYLPYHALQRPMPRPRATLGPSAVALLTVDLCSMRGASPPASNPTLPQIPVTSRKRHPKLDPSAVR